jgi:hypothetical protein
MWLQAVDAARYVTIATLYPIPYTRYPIPVDAARYVTIATLYPIPYTLNPKP